MAPQIGRGRPWGRPKGTSEGEQNGIDFLLIFGGVVSERGANQARAVWSLKSNDYKDILVMIIRIYWYKKSYIA